MTTNNSPSPIAHSPLEAVPLGYKRTDVGVIPEDWEVKTLADVCTPQGIVRGPFGGSLKKEMFVTSGFRVYEQKNAIYKSCEIGSYFIDESKYTEMHRFSVSPGDFIVSCSGTIGRIYQIPLDAPPGVINQALLKLTASKSVVNDRYFYVFFEWDDFQTRIIDSTQGGAMKNLVGMDVFKTTPLVLPPLCEQGAIAEALSDVGGLIAALDKLIAKKRAIKQAAMQQLLTGKTRLAGFSGEWEKKKLCEVAAVSKGTQLHNSAVRNRGQFPHLNGGISPSGYADSFNTPGETIAVSEGGNSCGYVQFMIEPYWCGGHCYSVLPRDVDNNFLYYALKVRQSSIMALRVGSGLPNVQKPALLGLDLVRPASETEQTAIATVLSDMDTEIEALERRRDKTKQIKQGMMQQLLTGRIRLLDPTGNSKGISAGKAKDSRAEAVS